MSIWRNNLSDPPGAANRIVDGRFQKTYPNVGAVSRGIMRSARRRGRERSHLFHFLTNPLEISVTYNVNTNVDLTDPFNSDSLMADLPPMRPGLIGISFSILLDRTYEVWDRSLPEGVLHDVAQLERVLGMPDLSGRTVIDDRFRYSVDEVYNRFPGVIVKRPVEFIFGGRHAFTFEGYVTSLSVSMMKFSREMTPVRAGINISAETWGTPESGADTLASTTGLNSRLTQPPPPGHPAGFPS